MIIIREHINNHTSPLSNANYSLASVAFASINHHFPDLESQSSHVNQPDKHCTTYRPSSPLVTHIPSRHFNPASRRRPFAAAAPSLVDGGIDIDSAAAARGGGRSSAGGGAPAEPVALRTQAAAARPSLCCCAPGSSRRRPTTTTANSPSGNLPTYSR